MATSTIPVRIATPDDESAILDLCWLAHAEKPERSLARGKVESMVRGCLVPGGAGFIGIIEVDGDVRAMAGLIVSQPWYSEDKEINDWLVFVRQDCRHLCYLSPLLRFMRKCAIKTGLPIVSGFVGDYRSEAKAAAYRRHFPAYGQLFRYDPNAGLTTRS